VPTVVVEGHSTREDSRTKPLIFGCLSTLVGAVDVSAYSAADASSADAVTMPEDINAIGDGAKSNLMMASISQFQSEIALVERECHELIQQQEIFAKLMADSKAASGGKVLPEVQQAEQAFNTEVMAMIKDINSRTYGKNPVLTSILQRPTLRPRDFPGVIEFIQKLHDATDPAFDNAGRLRPGMLPKDSMVLSLGERDIVIPKAWAPLARDLQDFYQQFHSEAAIDLRYKRSQFDAAQQKSRVGIFLQQLEVILKKITTVNKNVEDKAYHYSTKWDYKEVKAVPLTNMPELADEWNTSLPQAKIITGQFHLEGFGPSPLKTRQECFRLCRDYVAYAQAAGRFQTAKPEED